jgi:hypothetical protein
LQVLDLKHHVSWKIENGKWKMETEIQKSVARVPKNRLRCHPQWTRAFGPPKEMKVPVILSATRPRSASRLVHYDYRTG